MTSLKEIPLFSLLEPSHEPLIRRLLQPVELKAGQTLFRQGDLGSAMWVLGQGTEVNLLAAPQGANQPRVIARARGGDTLGEMALIDEGKRSATAAVVRGGPAHQIDAEEFARMRDGRQPAAFAVLRKLCIQLAHKLRSASNRVVPPNPTPSPFRIPLGRHPTEEELLAFPPFDNLPKVVKLALAQKLTVQDFDGVGPVFSEGDEADSAYLVVSGHVAVGRGGKTLSVLSPGTMIGLVALLDQGLRSANCVTQGPTRLLRLSRSDFELLFNASNRFAFDVVELISRQLVAHLRATNEMLSHTAQGSQVLPLDLEMAIDRELSEALPL